MKNTLGFAVMCVTLVAVSSPGFGYTFDEVPVEHWAGPANAANRAATVVDFGGGNSYTFGYRWDGSATSENMLNALNTADNGLTVDTHSWPWGVEITGLTFIHETVTHKIDSTAPLAGLYPAYWWSGFYAFTEYVYEENPDSGIWDLIDTIDHPTTSGDGENWQYAGMGASDRGLADGYWDGWTRGYSDAEAPTPVTAPEPMTLTLLALGGLGLIRTRRRRRQSV